jgi:hypothetical protein
MQTMTCPSFNETVSIVDDKFRHRDVRNNKSITLASTKGFSRFLISCTDVAGITGNLSMYSSIIFAPAALNPPT